MIVGGVVAVGVDGVVDAAVVAVSGCARRWVAAVLPVCWLLCMVLCVLLLPTSVPQLSMMLP